MLCPFSNLNFFKFQIFDPSKFQAMHFILDINGREEK
jgi:hypothetical protein